MAELHDREATDAEHDYLDDPIDFSQVHADDAFLDALGAAQPDLNGTFADDKLAALLLSWRHDVDAEPIGELVDSKLAVATVHAARIRQRRGSRLIAPLAAAAAVLAIAFAGVGLAARDAQPGDTLWGLTRVLYSDHARSVEAAAQVRTDLRQAEAALAKGRIAEAKTMLDQARHQLPTVSTEDGKSELAAQHDALVAKLPDNPALGASPPPAASPTTAPVSGTTDPATSTTNPTTTDPTTDPPTSTTEPTPTTSSSGSGRVETSSPNTVNTGPATEPAREPAGGPARTDGTGTGTGQSPAGTP